MMRLATLASLAVSASAFGFVTIGDWGGAAIGKDFEMREQIIGAAMAKTAAELNAPFVINPGDNFYWCGVQSATDAQFDTDFEKVFTQDSLMVPWISALGNHDYGYNVTAQTLYRSPNNNRWHMPSRYFSYKQKMSATQNMTVIVIDTSPCVSAYRSSDPSGWDPCSPKFNDCPNCKFHENVVAQDCNTQYVWLVNQLAITPKEDWLVIVGHHPAHEIDVADFVGAIEQHGFDLYINGHTHELNSYTVDNAGTYITSGAGCMVAIPNKTHELTSPITANHSHEYTWYSTTAGYTSHTWNDALTEVTTRYLAYNGTTIREFTTKKFGSTARKS
ncbi:Purple acid phosphatase 17 [Diplonema papillatum]|nr:Purple acid phosphatase 17 [Diplonema papillatum]